MLYREEKAVICTCIIIKYMLYREGEGSHMYMHHYQIHAI